ncbi:MAG: hypothetical protein DWQ09_02725 [Proteobacteria bacterium]|nr:MAG: hypothetical protein DWQ09_02725 [Pseudomonadota bacterium]QKK10934.1 MAG: SUMF1/EgtB/PvdO family nonheme iron enzyme [Pseudomonadota bacterium]
MIPGRASVRLRGPGGPIALLALLGAGAAFGQALPELITIPAGPFDTVPVGRYPRGASPFGLSGVAGQVYEWTAMPAGPGRALVKGGSWDDRGCGVCRPAAGHGRPVALKHVLIGFRLVREE